MKTYFKALFLLFFVFSCAPEELVINGILTTDVEPSNSGTIATINTESYGSIVQLIAVPIQNYIFKGWNVGDTALKSENPLFVNLNDGNMHVIAVFEEKDTDNDGVSDVDDLCPNTAEGEVVNADGCAGSQKDTDNDGVSDADDLCPNTAEGEVVNENGCAPYQRDTDNDGVMDDVDGCAGTPYGETVNADGCAGSQIGIEGINFMNGIFSGGTADVIEITGENGAENYEDSLGTSCTENYFPRGTLCDLSPYTNNPDFSFRIDEYGGDGQDAGATWDFDADNDDIGILVVDLGSEQFINSMSVFQMFADGKTTHIEAYAYPNNATFAPSSEDTNWSQLFPYTEVGEGTVSYSSPGGITESTVSDPLKIGFSGVFTRYIKLYVKNDGSLGDTSYIELRQVKAFYIK